MNLLLIEGPHAAPLAPQARRALQARARACGHALIHRGCRSLQSMLACLRRSARMDVRMLLLDSGDIATADPRLPQLREALDGLSRPYIEVHDDSAQELASRWDLRHPPLATVVFTRDRPQGHALALSIALRRLAAAVRVPC